jgi:zinc transporter 1
MSQDDESLPLLAQHLNYEDSPGASELAKHAGHSHGGHAHGSMNMRALVLHVIGDALGNVGVIATGLVIWLTTWKYKYFCDPIISLVIAIIIFSSALPLGSSHQSCINL